MTDHTEGRRWPQDFARRDGGRMWVRRDYEGAFDQIGWRTFSDVMSSDRPRLTRRVESRANYTVDLPSSTGATVRAHLKRHYAEPIRRPAFDHTASPAGVTGGIHEADAVGACQRAQVPTLDVLAAGQSPCDKPGRADSFFISEDLHGATQADDHWREQFTPTNAAQHASQRADLLKSMAHLIARLHQHRLFHRDLYWCHFMVRPSVSNAPEIRLIDLQRLRLCAFPAYPRLKDLAQFLVAGPLGSAPPTRDEWAAWYAHYRGVVRLSLLDRARLSLIRTRAAFYRIKGIKP